MNIVIINTQDSGGGAAKAALRLYKGFKLLGVNSSMVVSDKTMDDPKIIKIDTPKDDKHSDYIKSVENIQRLYIDQNRSKLTNTRLSFAYPGYDLTGLEVVRNADIINLHWINTFQSVETIGKLLSLGKAVVWTLHDQWAFTGGCHYSAGCINYKTDCKDCPQLKKDPYKLTYNTLTNKLKYFKSNKLTIVTPSKWLATIAKESILFNSKRIEVIPYGIQHNLYYPIEKDKAKNDLGISNDVTTIFFGAPNGRAKRKGFQQLIEALNYSMTDKKFQDIVVDKKILALIAGHPSDDLAKIPIPFKAFGFISSDQELSKLYNASDILALPSLEDNLPNQLLEALACATPVIAFDIGGVPDIITDNVTGRIVPSMDIHAYGDAIIDLAFNKDKKSMLGKNGRELIETSYKLENQALSYKKLFKTIIKRKLFHKRKSFDFQNPSTVSIDTQTENNFIPLFETYMQDNK